MARPGDGQEWFRIVGVVDDVREATLHDPAPELVYYPLARQTGDDLSVPLGMSFVVRADDTDQLANTARATVRALDPNLPISDVNTMDAFVTRARAQRAFVMVLLVIASGFALLLGSVGLYAVISYVVGQRQREIAIRMALGAQLTDIRRLVLTEAAWMVVLGTALGIGSAVLMAGRLQTLLFETSALDPVVFLGVSTLLAGILPARQLAPRQTRRAHRAGDGAARRVAAPSGFFCGAGLSPGGRRGRPAARGRG